ncbi:MAG: hypothetical protein ACXAC5_11940 [Promethearchaeota archaeon]|jgi:hypothetical protein
MTSDNQERGGESVQGTPVGSSVPFDRINSPGAYVNETTGHLFRVPQDAIQSGRSPLMVIEAKDPMRLRKISDNPFITSTKARLHAAQHDVSPNW